MLNDSVIADITEAVLVINTYRLKCLVWQFENCPLEELKHYIPKGKEELVVVCRKEDSYLPFRSTYQSDDLYSENAELNIELNFHDEYSIHIIMNNENEE